MADSAVFEWACALLEEESKMTRLQARGTMRLVLSAAGLTPGTLTPRQLRVIAIKVLPKELKARHIDGADEIGAKLADPPESVAPAHGDDGQPKNTPESIFRRLGRDRD